MKPEFLYREHTRTPFVQSYARKCKTCQKCLEDCPNEVINKVDLLWHKHALIVEPDKCTGCLKRINVCEYDVYWKLIKKTKDP